MISAFLLAVALNSGALLWDNNWYWDSVPTADGYYLYWSAKEFPTYRVWNRKFTPNTFIMDPARTPQSGEVIYYLVTSVNEAGESPSEHLGVP